MRILKRKKLSEKRMFGFKISGWKVFSHYSKVQRPDKAPGCRWLKGNKGDWYLGAVGAAGVSGRGGGNLCHVGAWSQEED